VIDVRHRSPETLPPDPSQIAHLRPSDAAGWGATLLALAATAGGAGLAARGGVAPWIAAQLLLALAFLQWFVLLHEAGHATLFHSRRMNRLVGQLAGVFALIPFYVWQRIHARHHRYTGWQDLDATTALLVPRAVTRFERLAVNFAWRTGLPLFSILYRVQNFWNLARIAPFLRRAEELPRARRSVIGLGVVLFALIVAAGPLVLLAAMGPALLLSLAVQDVILLSQHTHMPQHLSSGAVVRPFPPAEQGVFTRSLLLPRWLSWVLLRFDLHESHHRYVNVPGYRLHRIPRTPGNQVNWWHWLRAAKRLKGVDFLFGRREQTGLTL
jgi:fatty acid desaturase